MPMPIMPSRPVPRNISHIGHLVGTILTAGIWAPFWALASVITARKNRSAERRFAEQMSIYEQQRTGWQMQQQSIMQQPMPSMPQPRQQQKPEWR